jgi:hypothetical protein
MTEKALAWTVSFCVAIACTLLGVIALSCQHHSAAVARTCLEQGNAPLECDEIRIGG